jgi:hypothetical protein
VANKYALQPFVIQLSSGAMHFVDAGAMRDSASAVVTAAPAMFTTAMTGGSSGSPVLNPNPVPVSVTISGGTVSQIAISGVNTGQTSGTFTIPVGGSITVTYSVAPTFTMADIAPAAGWPFVNSVTAGYLAANIAGP